MRKQTVIALCEWQPWDYAAKRFVGDGELIVCRATVGVKRATIWLPGGRRTRTSRTGGYLVYGSHERLSRTCIKMRIITTRR